MQFIYDNMIAAMVAAIVLFMLIGVQLSAQRANIDANLHYMSRAQTLSLIEMIERDFPNVGAGVEPGTDPMIESYDWSGSTRWFEFRAATEPSESAPVERIRYVVSPSDSPICEEVAVDCLKVERLVDDGSGFRPSGASAGTLTEFEIELTPSTGTLRDVRGIHVRLAALSMAGEASLISRTSWETRFHPFSLGLQAP